MLDETIDTMALAIASITLDQIEQQLRDQGKADLADTIKKLQIDAGYHMAAISEGFDSPEGFMEQKLMPQTGELEKALSDDIIAQIKNFEPLTHERLHILVTIEEIMPEGDLKDELKTLNDELTQNVPSPVISAQTVKLGNLTP